MQKNGSYKNCKSLHRSFRSRRGESGQALTEYVLILSALGLAACVVLRVLTPYSVSTALANNVADLAKNSVEDAPFYIDWIKSITSGK